jgi:glycosidase
MSRSEGDPRARLGFPEDEHVTKIPRYPSCYQVNTRVWLTEISQELGRTATLDDIPDTELDRLKESGFDWIWFLSVWQTGPAGQRVSRTNPQWRREFQKTLADLQEEDIAGSGFAVTAYKAAGNLGGDTALSRLRDRLCKRGMRLMLDFVPNHTGLDHPWVEEHPEFYVMGSEQDLTRASEDYARVQHKQREIVLAHGRDPNFPGWPDTFQLNYGNPATQEAMIGELMNVARQCDGVRCDMANLVLPDVFERTWGVRAQPFWPRAIQRVRDRFPTFCFLAEAYWDLEWTLQQQGFDYTYDKRLYDRLRDRRARPVREHFMAGLDYQNKLARFLENHDEPRAATTFPPGVHEAAAVISFFCPGLRFFHQGQFEGREKHVSPHLCRAPDEPINEALQRFYTRLLTVMRQPVARFGQWQLLQCVPAWEGNSTWDCILAFGWQGRDAQRLLVTVNFAANQSQCYVRLPFSDLGDRAWRLQDLIGDAIYDRDGKDLRARGLYLDLSPWKASVFRLTQFDQA